MWLRLCIQLRARYHTSVPMSAKKSTRSRVQGGWADSGGASPGRARDTKDHGRAGRPAQAHTGTNKAFIYRDTPQPPTLSLPEFLSDLPRRRLSAASSVSQFDFQETRVRTMTRGGVQVPADGRPVVYWMSREQRVQDNWALLYAQKLALHSATPLHVVFCLVPKFLEATIRHFGFMLKGLQEVEKECLELDLAFHLLPGLARDVLPKFVSDLGAGAVVTDFAPLRVPRQWVSDVAKGLPEGVALYQVDAHNVVPLWETSGELEPAPRTIRGKINAKLGTYLTEFPPVVRHPHVPAHKPRPVDWPAVYARLEVDRSVSEVDWAVPGTKAGLANLHHFISAKLPIYAASRNTPTVDAQSNMSPWYHFGQVSVQRALLLIQEHRAAHKQSVDSYVNEALTWRELAENFCYYNRHYDSYDGADLWARETLDLHSSDPRDYLYSRDELEAARTHDDLWNAAQIQMAREGKMHGFLRMYWAKKILEWTESPSQAVEFTVYLNDRYSLDGRDPSGYGGIMWAICGTHDNAFLDKRPPERPVFGKIRWMSYQASRRKFDVPSFVQKYGATSVSQEH